QDSSTFSPEMSSSNQVVWISGLLLGRNIDRNDSSSSLSTSSSSWETAFLLLIHSLSLIVNLFLFAALASQRTKRNVMKIRISVMLLLLFNVIFSLTWTSFAVIFDLWEPPELVPKLIDIFAPWAKTGIEEIFLTQIIDNGIFLSGMIMFGIALDRYLNLFTDYSPFLDSSCFPSLLLISTLLYSGLIVDQRVLASLMGTETALFARVCLLLVPHLLSFLFLLISSTKTAPPHAFEPRMNSSLSRSFPRVNLLILILDLAMRLAFFFKLLEVNFAFTISTGSSQGDEVTKQFLDWNFKIAKWLYHLFPLYFCLFNLCLVRYYRILSSRIIDRLRSALCCCERRNVRVNYQSETLASILAEQKKRRMFVASSLH
ncbi:hypothetical protein PENTCL1PPCAC_27533, partial [Pristionchus entomophagus]